jgi:hypothetical protein
MVELSFLNSSGETLWRRANFATESPGPTVISVVLVVELAEATDSPCAEAGWFGPGDGIAMLCPILIERHSVMFGLSSFSLPGDTLLRHANFINESPDFALYSVTASAGLLSVGSMAFATAVVGAA